MSIIFQQRELDEQDREYTKLWRDLAINRAAEIAELKAEVDRWWRESEAQKMRGELMMDEIEELKAKK